MKEEVFEKLSQMKEYVGFLREYSKTTKEDIANDMKLKGAIERYFQVALEAVIDIANMVIAKEGFRKPVDYSESIAILAENGILPESFSKRFRDAIKFRNVLVHMYEKVLPEGIEAHLKKLDDFDIFAKHIAKYLERVKE